MTLLDCCIIAWRRISIHSQIARQSFRRIALADADFQDRLSDPSFETIFPPGLSWNQNFPSRVQVLKSIGYKWPPLLPHMKRPYRLGEFDAALGLCELFVAEVEDLDDHLPSISTRSLVQASYRILGLTQVPNGTVKKSACSPLFGHLGMEVK